MSTPFAPEWFISVFCESCAHRVLLFRDLSEGQSDLHQSRWLITCPYCFVEGAYLVEHYQQVEAQAGNVLKFPSPKERAVSRLATRTGS